MVTKWRCKKCRKLALIMIGILFFIGLAFAEDAIKPTPTNLLLKDLRVMASWVEDIQCIGTIDAKYTGPGRGLGSGYALVNAMLDSGVLNLISISRGPAKGWGKVRSHFWGQMSHEEAQAQWEVYKPIRDLLDLAIPSDVPVLLEWWVTTSQYRVFFEPPINKDIDKLNAYIVKIMFQANKLESSEWTDEKDKGGTFTSDNSRRWHVGKSNTMRDPKPFGKKGHKGFNKPDPRPLAVKKGSEDEKISDRSGGHMPYAYIKPIGGGAQHRVFLDPRIFTEYRGWSMPPIWDRDANYAYAVGELSWLPAGDDETRKWRGWWPKAKPESDGGPITFSDRSGWWHKAKPTPGGPIGPHPILKPSTDGPYRVSWSDPDAIAYPSVPGPKRLYGGGEHGKGDTMSWPDPDAWPESRRNEI